MRNRSSQGIGLLVVLLTTTLLSCQKPEPLTVQKAQAILDEYQFHAEPIYAEVPQKVWWTPQAPQDDYDAKAVRTLHNLETAGFVTVTESHPTADSATYLAKVTAKGFNILGTAPSMRGPVYRGKICEKHFDGLRNFQRHPSEPTTGHAELVWHYASPTPLYPMFETKINKPLDKPFASYVAFYFKDHQWRFDVTVNKTEAQQ